MRPPRYWTWERAARVAIFVQVVMTVIIASYFAIVTDQQNHVLARQAITSAASNKAIISEIRTDLDIHAHASADRTCGVARLLDYLASSSPLQRTPTQLEHIHRQVHAACRVVPIGETTG